jgi:hypothetical protein
MVILTRTRAYKFPNPSSWKSFLFGLLNNMNEVRRSGRPGLCPVLWSIPGGWLVVMPRAWPISPFDWACMKHTALIAEIRTHTHIELKPCSWGFYKGSLVAVDYGWQP